MRANRAAAAAAVSLMVTIPVGAVAQAGPSATTAASPPAGSVSQTPQTSGREADGWAGVTVGADRVRSRVGDRDNFGYGLGYGPPDCAFYDLRERGDERVFDYEPEGGGDESDSWTHDFPVNGTPVRVRLVTRDIFADGSNDARIEIDGVVRNFEQGIATGCDYAEGGQKRVFFLGGKLAAVAADGAVVVTFHENGDDIAIDRAKLTIRFS